MLPGFLWNKGAAGAMRHACGVRVDGAAPRGFLRFLSLTAFQAEGCGGGFAADYKKAGPIPVISTEAKRSGEISPL